MKVVRKKVTVYLDMFSIDSADQPCFGCAYISDGGNVLYTQSGDGSLRNKVIVEVMVPVKAETIDLGVATAEVVESEKGATT